MDVRSSSRIPTVACGEVAHRSCRLVSLICMRTKGCSATCIYCPGLMIVRKVVCHLATLPSRYAVSSLASTNCSIAKYCILRPLFLRRIEHNVLLFPYIIAAVRPLIITIYICRSISGLINKTLDQSRLNFEHVQDILYR